MNRRIATAAVSLVAMLALAGCSSTEASTPASPSVAATAEATASSAPPASTTPIESPSVSESTPTAEPLSDIEAAVQAFVGALDELGIEHTDPVRAEVGLSGAVARFDISINGYDAGINVFADSADLASWGEKSDTFGGIYVEHGTSALSLNSKDGIANSAEIAPKIAEALGGVAHGV